MNICKDGLNKMHRIVECAPGDIARRLWTLYWLARMVKSVTGSGIFVELGTREGDSTKAILAACIDLEGQGVLWSFDIEDCSRCINDPAMLAYWNFSKGNSVTEGNEWSYPRCSKKHVVRIVNSVSLLFIDTDHTYETTKEEIAAWHQHICVGGCIAFHDYWLDEPERPISRGVKPAVDEFANQHKDDFVLETHDAYNDTGFAILWRIK